MTQELFHFIYILLAILVIKMTEKALYNISITIAKVNSEPDSRNASNLVKRKCNTEGVQVNHDSN